MSATRKLVNTGAPIIGADGKPAKGIEGTLALIRKDGTLAHTFDATSNEMVFGLARFICDAAGIFHALDSDGKPVLDINDQPADVELWINDRGTSQTWYLCHVDIPGFSDFVGRVPAGPTPLTFAEFMANGVPPTAQQITALNLHIQNNTNPHGVTKAQVGLGSADNTSDVNKPVSTAQAAADTAVLNAANAHADNHAGRIDNPHQVTKTQVGLGNADNTSDINKPVSTAQALADAAVLNTANAHADTMIPLTQRGTANGVATLDAVGLIPITQMPRAALERLMLVADQAARYLLTADDVQNGDTVKQVDTDTLYYVVNEASLGNDAGYEVYAAGVAAQVAWGGVTGRPAAVDELQGINTGNENTTTLGTILNLALTKATLVAADLIAIRDSVTGLLKTTTWANLLATLVGTQNIWTRNQVAEITPIYSAGGALVVDFSKPKFFHQMMENTVIKPDVTSLVAGQSISISIEQHATAAKTLAFSAFIFFSGGTVPTITSALRGYAKFIADVEVARSSVVTLAVSTPGQLTWVAHALDVGDRVMLTTTGALLTGLTANQVYFVQSVISADIIALSATNGGAALAFSGAQNGVHTAWHAHIDAAMIESLS